MNLNLYLEDDLAKQLDLCAKAANRKKNSIIRQAVKEWLGRHNQKEWPSSIIEFQGIEEFDSIDELRKNLLMRGGELF